MSEKAKQYDYHVVVRPPEGSPWPKKATVRADRHEGARPPARLSLYEGEELKAEFAHVAYWHRNAVDTSGNR